MAKKFYRDIFIPLSVEGGVLHSGTNFVVSISKIEFRRYLNFFCCQTLKRALTPHLHPNSCDRLRMCIDVDMLHSYEVRFTKQNRKFLFSIFECSSLFGCRHFMWQFCRETILSVIFDKWVTFTHRFIIWNIEQR